MPVRDKTSALNSPWWHVPSLSWLERVRLEFVVRRPLTNPKVAFAMNVLMRWLAERLQGGKRKMQGARRRRWQC